MATLIWALKVRRTHDGCGKLDVSGVKDITQPLYVICPVHGRIEGPLRS
jgi:hypothetical protein